jgi:hypothetical protein
MGLATPGKRFLLSSPFQLSTVNLPFFSELNTDKHRPLKTDHVLPYS